MSTGLIWAAFILVAMGWFAIGWVARGHENRKYAEGRMRAVAADAARIQAMEHPWPVEAERIAPAIPAVVNVHLAMPPSAPQPMVIQPQRWEIGR